MDQLLQQFAQTVRSAASKRTPLRVRGGGSKDFYGGELRGEILEVNAYRGIVDYEPTELVITARAGTPLDEIEATLHAKKQMLAFEPPHFDQLPSLPARVPHAGEGNIAPAMPDNRLATLGGCIAAGLSGPRRAYAGAARDFVLGVRILDGKGDDLRFGGQVMKNVAGFDVSRLMAGSLGTLGVILEISLKVLPLPVAEATLGFEKTAAEAIASSNEWAGQPLPVSATAWSGGKLSCDCRAQPLQSMRQSVNWAASASVRPKPSVSGWASASTPTRFSERRNRSGACRSNRRHRRSICPERS